MPNTTSASKSKSAVSNRAAPPRPHTTALHPQQQQDPPYLAKVYLNSKGRLEPALNSSTRLAALGVAFGSRTGRWDSVSQGSGGPKRSDVAVNDASGGRKVICNLGGVGSVGSGVGSVRGRKERSESGARTKKTEMITPTAGSVGPKATVTSDTSRGMKRAGSSHTVVTSVSSSSLASSGSTSTRLSTRSVSSRGTSGKATTSSVPPAPTPAAIKPKSQPASRSRSRSTTAGLSTKESGSTKSKVESTKSSNRARMPSSSSSRTSSGVVTSRKSASSTTATATSQRSVPTRASAVASRPVSATNVSANRQTSVRSASSQPRSAPRKAAPRPDALPATKAKINSNSQVASGVNSTGSRISTVNNKIVSSKSTPKSTIAAPKPTSSSSSGAVKSATTVNAVTSRIPLPVRSLKKLSASKTAPSAKGKSPVSTAPTVQDVAAPAVAPAIESMESSDAEKTVATTLAPTQCVEVETQTEAAVPEHASPIQPTGTESTTHDAPTQKEEDVADLDVKIEDEYQTTTSTSSSEKSATAAPLPPITNSTNLRRRTIPPLLIIALNIKLASLRRRRTTNPTRAQIANQSNLSAIVTLAREHVIPNAVESVKKSYPAVGVVGDLVGKMMWGRGDTTTEQVVGESEAESDLQSETAKAFQACKSTHVTECASGNLMSKSSPQQQNQIIDLDINTPATTRLLAHAKTSIATLGAGPTLALIVYAVMSGRELSKVVPLLGRESVSPRRGY
ncbi:hypothetical protein HK102_006913 [Quaeritorhiza haematococci]|nr:hypothetical protein HK102_006913 [Quaeritorhiza haematococci]